MDPCFLTIKPSAEIGADIVATWTMAATAARGTVIAAAPASAVEPLEPGTKHSGIILIRFAFAADLEVFWASAPAYELRSADRGLIALSCTGLPYGGLPGNFVPTIATVDIPASEHPPTFMLIEGTGHDQERMDRYRDMILPMMRERGSYYIAFELGGNVKVRAGAWEEGIFAISRWPSKAHAEDFWYSPRYQDEAIPIRTGVGKFDVQIVEGVEG